MAGFVQIIEFQTSRIDEVKQMGERFRASASGRENAPKRITLTADRDRPNTYLNIVEFESYESAMANSNHPETSQFAEQMAKLCDGPPRFYNLDITQQLTL